MGDQMETSSSTPSIDPTTIQNVSNFNSALTALEDALRPVFELDFDQHKDRSALEMARADLMAMFTLNVAGWTMCALKGEDPQENFKLTEDLKRTKEYIKRFKMIESRKTAPRVNPTAAKNFVRNALWEIPPTPTDRDDKADI
ncbi:unnamed protein product [Auanema sp. JU1783]|nr:unnamed protein product [Auanema sp. JU1783]